MNYSDYGGEAEDVDDDRRSNPYFAASDLLHESMHYIYGLYDEYGDTGLNPDKKEVFISIESQDGWLKIEKNKASLKKFKMLMESYHVGALIKFQEFDYKVKDENNPDAPSTKVVGRIPQGVVSSILKVHDTDVGNRANYDYIEKVDASLLEQGVYRTVNYENRMNVDLVEAKGLGTRPGPSDAFPGKGNVTEFNKFVFWNGLDMNITLSNITESPDKEYVTFNVTMGEPFMRELSSSSSLDSLIFMSDWKTRPISASSIAVSKKLLQSARVISQNGMVHITTPLQGLKSIRMFSPNGQLLFETSMDGTDLQFPWPRHLGAQNVILAVSQGKTNLYMGIVNGH